jgi:hypothetical protein
LSQSAVLATAFGQILGQALYPALHSLQTPWIALDLLSVAEKRCNSLIPYILHFCSAHLEETC